jgi:hypothetical protein
METFFKAVLAGLTLLLCFYSTTVAMSFMTALDSAPLAF